MAMSAEDYVEHLDEDELKSVIIKIMTKLDDLDEDEFFGEEGWRVRFGLEEED